ncbi:hypothetical protein MMC13_003754 [Lambiella insularis]|nr:hypothetical protein [Lambiella insularis]
MPVSLLSLDAKASRNKLWEPSNQRGPPEGSRGQGQSAEPSAPTSSTPTCKTCQKSQSDLSSALQRCAKCQETHYCSRECQKADWKDHKKVCGKPGVTSEAPKQTSMDTVIQMMSQMGGEKGSAFNGLKDGSYLENLPQKVAFAQLIDSYRLRVEDEYVFRGDAGGLYAGEDPLPDFKSYLNRAEKKSGVLPSWWSKENRRKCETMATNTSQWSNLRSTVEKRDISEHYKDSLMPMKLRMLAEKVEGSNVTSM